jgi:DNA polymerase III epsilon subunit-like protein
MREIEIGALDTETGGLNPLENGLISVAIVPPKHFNKLKPLYVLLEYNKALKYDHKALEVNGFFPIEDKKTNEVFWWQTVEGKRKCVKGTKEEDAMEMVLSYLEVYLKDSFISGCNIGFDKSFLIEACKRADKNLGLSADSKKSFQARLDKCLLRKTIELQTLALCAHIQNQITLPCTSKPTESKAPDKSQEEQKTTESKESKSKRRPSLSLNSIAKAVSEIEGQKEIKRASDQHDALEDALLTLKLTETLAQPWNLKPPQETKKKSKDSQNPEIITP